MSTLLSDYRFLHYEVSIAGDYISGLGQGTDTFVLDFFTPYVLWSVIDQPFWNEIIESSLRDGGVDVGIRQADVYPSIYQCFMNQSMQVKSKPTSRLDFFTLLKGDAKLRSYWEKWFSPRLTTSEKQLVETLAGRQLLLSEVNALWRTIFPDPDQPLRTLQKLYLQGFFDWRAAITEQACQRCGYAEQRGKGNTNKRINTLGQEIWKAWLSRLQSLQSFISGKDERLIAVPCSRCGLQTCYYCPHCLSLGKARSCEPLLLWQGRTQQEGSTVSKVSLAWLGELSTVQQAAADQLFSFVHEEQTQHIQVREFLLWAVCGAGKTEILFPTLYRSLTQGQKVLIASPRRDVIVELAPRLQEAFPESRVRVLHAQSEERFAAGDMYVATTHQTLRFVNYFDLAIIDEEDAFPMHHDPVLAPAVHRALKEAGTLVYLTATPRVQMQKRANQGELASALISQRYHGHPLAVPSIRPLGNWRKQIKQEALLTPLIHYLLHLAEQQRFGYLFLPHVHDLKLVYDYLQESLLPYLREMYPNFPQQFSIATVHAAHPQRAEIVQRFRDHHIHLLLTTTILERGVTIPYSDAAVLGSDDPVFDTAALIQIAGRVGRKYDDPVGQVWFFPEARTNAQLRCRQQIQRWNRLASGVMDRGLKQ